MREIDGGQAFPCGYSPESMSADQQGMSLRAYFAGQALIGILANSSAHFSGGLLVDGKKVNVVEACVMSADALIAELNKSNGKPTRESK